MKIQIVIGQLLCGGSERVVYQLYQSLTSKGYLTQVLVLGKIDEVHFPKIKQEHFTVAQENSPKNKILRNLYKVCFIRRNIKKFQPDILISFIDETNILTIIANFFLSSPLIISERNNPDYSGMSKPWYYLRRLLYRFADTLVVANKGLKAKCLASFKVKKIDIIPNLMRYNNLEKHPSKLIMAVGSLSKQKRFDLLINAVAVLDGKNALSDYIIVIYGDGFLRQELNNLIQEKQLSDVITIHGETEHIMEHYANAEIFVLSSDYEGQPNVLLEAMSSGVACISTKCDFGPSELIEDGKDGLLVENGNILQLANAIETLIIDENLRLSMGQEAKAKIIKEFSEEAVMKKWINLFDGLTRHESQHTALQ